MRIGAAWKFPVTHRNIGMGFDPEKRRESALIRPGAALDRASCSSLVKRCARAAAWRLPSPSVSTGWGVGRIGCV